MANKKIVNRTRGYAPGATKKYVFVPDTQSPAYRQQLTDGFRQRIWQEIEDCNTSGGRVLFGSFTYAPQNRIYYDATGKDAYGNIRSWHFPVFCKAHYVDFMRRIRVYFYQKYGLTGPGTVKVNRQGKTVIHCDRQIKVIWPCEYGMDEARQQAPHYHPLLFIPKEYFDCPEFKSDSATKLFIQKMWPHGFIFWSKKEKGGLWVKSSFAATYCSKYCFKSFNYYNREDIRAYLFDQDGNRIKERFDKLKGMLPHAWHSQNFGIGLIEKYDSYEAFCNGIDFRFDSKLKVGKTYMSRMPLYIRRKLLFDLMPDKSYVKNDKCIQWTLRDFAEHGKSASLRIGQLFSEKNLARYVTDDDVKRLLKRDDIQTVHDLYEYITSILDNRSWYEYYTYNLVWRGLIAEDYSQLTWLDELSQSEFQVQSYIQYELNLRSYYNITKFNSDGYLLDMSKYFPNAFNNLMTFSDCCRFAGFEVIHNLYDIIYDDFRLRSDQEYQRKLLERKKVLFEIKTG